jgi:hypothetical protein
VSENVGNAFVNVVSVGDLPFEVVMIPLPFKFKWLGDEVMVVVPNVVGELESGFSHGLY